MKQIATVIAVAFVLCGNLLAAAAQPNIVVIFADDLGYGDLSCFGHPTIRTPNLDRMASAGIRFTQFYSAACVCTPSRAALLTGSLPIRNGMCSDSRRVLFPNSAGGIPASEITLAEALRDVGYATACIGKWHLGHQPQFMPTSNGFDYYFGISYSNDMDAVPSALKGRDRFRQPKIEYWNVPLIRNNQIIERPADQTTITKRYTEEAVRFILAHKDVPFFVYLPHNLPHVPLFRSPEFEGHSRGGYYGDVIEEIDWSVGCLLDTLKEIGQEDNTIVWFTSDNGPWLEFRDHGGSAGPLREGKGCTFEGGMREPTIAWWPGKIPAGTISADLGSTMDIFTTSLKLAGASMPLDRVIDGLDLSPVLFDSGPSPRDSILFYRGNRLMAVRKGPWKAHYITEGAYDDKPPVAHDPPLLYNLEVDPSERRDVADQHMAVIAAITALSVSHRTSFVPPPSQLEIPISE